MKPSHELTVKEFDDITSSNYRGLWLMSRAELGHMVSQEPLPTHDGRPGNRGCVVNIGSNLALVSRPGTRECPRLVPCRPILSPCWAGTNGAQPHIRRRRLPS